MLWVLDWISIVLKWIILGWDQVIINVSVKDNWVDYIGIIILFQC